MDSGHEPQDEHTPKENTVQHISSTRPVAKRVYICADCGKPILKGQKHYKNIYKLGKDDTLRWYRTHIECW